MSKSKLIGILLFIFLTGKESIEQNTLPVKWYFTSNFVFDSGYWVYQDSTTSVIDSITLMSVQHGYYGPNPVQMDYTEYFLINYYSHTFQTYFNDFFWINLWRRNGGGQWAELGQPVMHIGQFDQYPEVGNGFNGYEILGIMDSITVGDHVFYNIVWCRIYEDLQYQHEFDYDTDLYFGEDVGIVRKEYTDNNGIHHVWNLTNWGSGQYVALGDLSGQTSGIAVNPNPASNDIHLMPIHNYWLQLTSCQGNILREQSGSWMNLSGLPSGIYLLSIFREGDNIPVVKKIIKM